MCTLQRFDQVIVEQSTAHRVITRAPRVGRVISCHRGTARANQKVVPRPVKTASWTRTACARSWIKHCSRIKSGVVILASPTDGKVTIAVGVTPDLVKRVPAGQVVKQIAPIGGGGRPDFAEAVWQRSVKNR